MRSKDIVFFWSLSLRPINCDMALFISQFESAQPLPSLFQVLHINRTSSPPHWQAPHPRPVHHQMDSFEVTLFSFSDSPAASSQCEQADSSIQTDFLPVDFEHTIATTHSGYCVIAWSILLKFRLLPHARATPRSPGFYPDLIVALIVLIYYLFLFVIRSRGPSATFFTLNVFTGFQDTVKSEVDRRIPRRFWFYISVVFYPVRESRYLFVHAQAWMMSFGKQERRQEEELFFFKAIQNNRFLSQILFSHLSQTLISFPLTKTK